MVYDINKELVKPEDVPRVLNGAVVEVYFKLTHLFIGTANAVAVDSFGATVEQIVVLKPSPVPLQVPFVTMPSETRPV